MALFKLFKKKEETKAPACCCSAETSSCCCGSHEKADTSCCCGKPVDGICCIKVLGAGCKACHEQYDYVLEAVKKLGLNVPVEYITDLAKIMEFGVMTMPAIVINETVAVAGKTLKPRDVEKLLQTFGN
jgi:small redox-active disulfide protein 2